MKRILALLLATALLFSLCACGSGGEDGKGKQEVSVNLPDNGKKAPSEEMIAEDVRNALAVKNQYASLVGLETVKSLTEEGSYSLTLTVTAETKYADWTYEADLSYTKYDQGWMLDDVDWNTEAYQLSRLPNEEEITVQILDTLEKSKWSSGEKPDSMEFSLPLFQLDIDDTLETELIAVRYTIKIKYLHGYTVIAYRTNWRYNSQADCWEGVMENDRIVVEPTSKGTHDITANISGEWGNVIISNVVSGSGAIGTLQEFDAQWNGKTEHFVYSGENYGDSNKRFSSDDGTDILMFLSGDFIVVLIGEYSDGKYNNEASCTIMGELPPIGQKKDQ